MKATLAISAALGLLLVLLTSCARPGSNGASGSDSRATPPREIGLTNAAATLSLSIPAEFIGPMRLQASGDSLLASDFHPGSVSGAAWLRVGDKRFPVLPAAQPAPAVEARSNDWQYVRIDGAIRDTGELKFARRHLLLVEPDLVVVLDELVLSNSTVVELHLPSGKSFQHDSVRDEWSVNSERAGVVARLFSLPQSAQSWLPATPARAGGASANPGPGSLRSLVAESGAEFQHLSIFSIQTNQPRRSLGFKLLESDTAIGARIHREGLPTLVAFRKLSCVGEANLTGLKFTTPVAVDVFRPKPRQQRPR